MSPVDRRANRALAATVAAVAFAVGASGLLGASIERVSEHEPQVLPFEGHTWDDTVHYQWTPEQEWLIDTAETEADRAEVLDMLGDADGVAEVQEVEQAPPIEEDEPGWDCATMGNRVCGPSVADDVAALIEERLPDVDVVEVTPDVWTVEPTVEPKSEPVIEDPVIEDDVIEPACLDPWLTFDDPDTAWDDLRAADPYWETYCQVPEPQPTCLDPWLTFDDPETAWGDLREADPNWEVYCQVPEPSTPEAEPVIEPSPQPAPGETIEPEVTS